MVLTILTDLTCWGPKFASVLTAVAKEYKAAFLVSIHHPIRDGAMHERMKMRAQGGTQAAAWLPALLWL